MALTLSLSYTERNDNKLLTITDTTVDWGTGGNIDVSAITTLTLNVNITTSNGTSKDYTQIDLVDLNGLGGSSTQTDLVFELDCSILEIGGVSIGTNTDYIPDGVWNFTYTVDEGLGTEVSFTESILVEGRVRVSLYELGRTLPTIYNCGECKSKQIMDTVFGYGLLNVLESNGYVAKNEELVNQLYVLERIITNGSTYSW
jgi:hypothetical protein